METNLLSPLFNLNTFSNFPAFYPYKIPSHFIHPTPNLHPCPIHTFNLHFINTEVNPLPQPLLCLQQNISLSVKFSLAAPDLPNFGWNR